MKIKKPAIFGFREDENQEVVVVKTITANELKKRLERDEVLLIDVREPAEHRSESIESARLIPLGQISSDKLPAQSRPIILHCRSGKRSAEACEKLLKQNPNLEVYSLEGGIVAWKESGGAVKLGRHILPLDRQTQLTAGFLAFFGTLLGAFVHPGFYILPAFIGLGLMFAGLTGWCGLAKILAKMPWNQ
jgi:rhodanese-related sulfurtransferase